MNHFVHFFRYFGDSKRINGTKICKKKINRQEKVKLFLLMEKLKILRTEKVKSFLDEKDITAAWVAQKLNMTKQNFYLLLKKEYFKPEVSHQLLELFGENFTETEIVKETEKEKVSSFTMDKFLEVMEENRFLWKVIASNGIKIPANFNLGELVSNYGSFLFNQINHKPTHL